MGLFCKHRWKEKERHFGSRVYYYGGKSDIIIIIQECEKCGKLKKVSIP